MEAARATRTVGTEVEKLEQKKQAFEQLGRGLVVTGTALTAVTALSIKAAAGWESAWAGVTKTVEGTPEQMQRVEDSLRGLTAVLPASHDEIAAVAEAAGQLGIETDNVASFTRTMIDMGETTNLSANDAATALARFMNIMGTAQGDVDNLGSAIVGLGNNYATTEAEIVEMAMRLAGAGNQVGLSEGQVLGLSTALSSVGIEAEAGGSAMSKVMIDIAASVEEGGSRLEMFAEVAGVSADTFAQKWKSDPAAALSLFVSGLSNAEAQGSSTLGVLAELGITEVRMRDALLRSASAADMFAGAMQDGNDAFDENNALTLEAAKRYETVESKMAIAGNAVRDAAIDFGEVFLPAVAGAAEGVTEFAGFMAGLPDPVQGVIGVLTSAVGVVALLGGAALIAVPKVVEFKIAMEGLGISMRTVGLIGGGAILALTALVTVVGSVAAAQAAAEQKAQSYADTLAAGTRKVTEATRDMIAENLTADRSFLWISQGSLADNAETLGLSISTVTDAIAGNADALDEVQAAIQLGIDEGYKPATEANTELNSAALLLQSGLEGEIGALDKAAEKARQKEEATKTSSDATVEATQSTEDFEAATQEAVGALDEMIDALLNVAGGTKDIASAHDDALGSINALVSASEAEGAALDGTNDASIRLRDSLRDVEQAHLDSAVAILENGGTLQDAQAEWQAGRDRVIDMRIAMGESRAEAILWADQNLGSAAEVVGAMSNVSAAVNSVPTAPVIDLTIRGSSEVYNELMRVQDAIRAVTGNKSVHVSTGQGGQGGLTFADGGIVNGSVREFASGDFLPGIYPATPGGIHRFAEAGYDEMYGTTDPKHAARTYGIWQTFGDRMGFSQPQAQAAGNVVNLTQNFYPHPEQSSSQIARQSVAGINAELRK